VRVAYTRQARRDLAHIYDRGLKWGERVAQQAEKRIVLECRRLGRTPNVGAQTDISDVRRLPIRRYPFTIFYRIIPDADRIDILRVVHSAAIRDLGKVPD
jgi:plasmid stabilization system protein ParE